MIGQRKKQACIVASQIIKTQTVEFSRIVSEFSSWVGCIPHLPEMIQEIIIPRVMILGCGVMILGFRTMIVGFGVMILGF